MSFVDISPVFDEFLPYFTSHLAILTFSTQCHAKIEQFSARRHQDFHWCWSFKKTGKTVAYFLFMAGEIEHLAKIFTLEETMIRALSINPWLPFLHCELHHIILLVDLGRKIHLIYNMGILMLHKPFYCNSRHLIMILHNIDAFRLIPSWPLHPFWYDSVSLPNLKTNRGHIMLLGDALPRQLHYQAICHDMPQ